MIEFLLSENNLGSASDIVQTLPSVAMQCRAVGAVMCALFATSISGTETTQRSAPTDSDGDVVAGHGPSDLGLIQASQVPPLLSPLPVEAEKRIAMLQYSEDSTHADPLAVPVHMKNGVQLSPYSSAFADNDDLLGFSLPQ